MQLKLVFANILGGREFMGTTYGEMNFGREALNKYVDAIAAHKPDVLSVAEIHLEDEAHSEMVQRLASDLGMPYFDFLGSDKSHLAEGKTIGNAILSKYPIVKKDHFLMDSPMIEVDRPDGQHWIMHNKPAQTALIQVGNRQVSVTSLHYFPFHHFNRKMNELEFAPQRQNLVDHLTKQDGSITPIITGDFNNKGLVLTEAFPELFDAGFSDALELKSSIAGIDEQFDHILYRKDDCVLVEAKSFSIPSDHLALYAVFNV